MASMAFENGKKLKVARKKTREYIVKKKQTLQLMFSSFVLLSFYTTQVLRSSNCATKPLGDRK